MSARGVDIFLGTLERPDETLMEKVLADVEPLLSGVGVQWAGRGALARLHQDRPELRIYQTEQECGDGRNDWRYAQYAWSLMRHYFTHGADAYWNTALREGGRSRWGWTQKSFITVDSAERSYR